MDMALDEQLSESDGQWFLGHRIEASVFLPVGMVQYAVPALDPESRFESLKEAKRFIREYRGERAVSGPGCSRQPD